MSRCWLSRTPSNAQSGFDNEVNIALDRILPESLISSGEHRVTGARRVGDNSLVFDIESQAAGPQSAESIALTMLRIHEARTLAQASNQFAQDNRQQAEEGRGQLRVEGDSIAGILTSPFSTGATVVDQFGNNVKHTFEEFGEFPGPADERATSAAPAPGDPVFVSYRRSIANQLKLDVYSSNPAVQNFLNTLARARVTGSARAGVTTVSLGRSPEVQVESGRLRERVRLAVVNEEESALFNKADTALREAGIDGRSVGTPDQARGAHANSQERADRIRHVSEQRQRPERLGQKPLSASPTKCRHWPKCGSRVCTRTTIKLDPITRVD